MEFNIPSNGRDCLKRSLCHLGDVYIAPRPLLSHPPSPLLTWYARWNFLPGAASALLAFLPCAGEISAIFLCTKEGALPSSWGGMKTPGVCRGSPHPLCMGWYSFWGLCDWDSE